MLLAGRLDGQPLPQGLQALEPRAREPRPWLVVRLEAAGWLTAQESWHPRSSWRSRVDAEEASVAVSAQPRGLEQAQAQGQARRPREPAAAQREPPLV